MRISGEKECDTEKKKTKQVKIKQNKTKSWIIAADKWECGCEWQNQMQYKMNTSDEKEEDVD